MNSQTEERKKFIWTEKQKEAIRLLRDPEYTEVFLYGGSRSAKTFTALAEIIHRCVIAPRTSHCVCRFEQVDCMKNVFNQTLDKVNHLMYRDLLWDKDVGIARKMIGRGELRFKNGSYIAFLGVNGNKNLEKILGSEWSTIFINEATEVSSSSYYTLRTRLAEKSSLVNKMYLDANPPVKRHWLYKRFELKQNLETGKPLRDDIDFAKLQMNPADNVVNIPSVYVKKMQSYDQPLANRQRFWLGEYADVLDGAVFKDEIAQLDREGRECEFPIDKKLPVYAVFDVGQTTACWVVCAEHDRIELIDYIESFGMSVAWYIERLINEEKYNIKSIILPHDAMPYNHITGTSIEEEYRQFGQKYDFYVGRLPKTKWQDSINALRVWMSSMWFHSKKTVMGVDALRNYEYGGLAGTTELENVKPKHNWASHGTDALKYVALWAGRDMQGIGKGKKDTQVSQERLLQLEAIRRYNRRNTPAGIIEEVRNELQRYEDEWY